MKYRFTLFLLYLISVSFGQSYTNTYSSGAFLDMQTVGNRLFVLTASPTTFTQVMLTKMDNMGNVIWTKLYNNSTVQFFSAEGGRLNFASTGGSGTKNFSVDTLNGNIIGSFAYYPCPPNPQNNSDKLLSLPDGKAIKIGCDPQTFQQTIFISLASSGTSSISARSIITTTNVNQIGNARITKAGAKSFIIFGQLLPSKAYFFAKVNDPMNMNSITLHILKKDLPDDLAPDFATNGVSNSNQLIFLFRNNNQYTYIQSDTSLTSFNAHSRLINNLYVSHLHFENNVLYSAMYLVTGSTSVNPVIQTVNVSNFTPIQTLSYPSVAVTGTGSANFPLRSYKIANIGNTVYLGYGTNNFNLTRSTNQGITNCSAMANAPAFTTLNLTDSAQVVQTTSAVAFPFYQNNAAITMSVLPAYSSNQSCLLTGVLEQQSSLILSIAAIENSTYRISSESSYITEWRLSDINGKAILTEQLLHDVQKDISLDHLPSGVYVLKVKTSEGLYKTFKLIR